MQKLCGRGGEKIAVFAVLKTSFEKSTTENSDAVSVMAYIKIRRKIVTDKSI